MKSSLIGWLGLAFGITACGTNVNVGGPRADDLNGDKDAGNPPVEVDSAVAQNDSATVESDSATVGSDGGEPVDPRIKAEGYATGNVACTVDTDCCLVIDQCKELGLVVGARDKDTVTNLLKSASMDRCLACISPFVQVFCNQGKCTGMAVDFTSLDGARPSEGFGQDHCGAIGAPPEPINTDSMFGCGK